MYPYHNRIKQRIQNGELVSFEFVEDYPRIGNALVLHFNTVPFVRPIRPHRYTEYVDILAEWRKGNGNGAERPEVKEEYENLVDHDFVKEFGERVAAGIEDSMKLHEATKEIGMERILELVEADREGRCVVLPCKPSGVTVYQLRKKRHRLGEGVSQRRIYCTEVWSDGYYSMQHSGATDCDKKNFGKTWFLTEQEAEEALKKMKEAQENE